MKQIPAFGLVLALMASGCIDATGPGDGPPASTILPRASLLCLDGGSGPVCNMEATLTPTTRQANELSIAVNPKDPLNIIAAGKDYTPNEAGDCVWAGVYASKDGGLTWKNQNVPGSPWKKLLEPNAPVNQDFSKFWCVTDPVVAFGPDGTAYWTVMPYQCDRISGSKVGRGVVPQGGFNDWFWTCSSMYVLVSHDGGLTWPEWQQVAFGPRLEHDKQWITTAPNGNVLLCWDRSEHLTQTGTPADQIEPGTTMVCSVSKDKGKSWAPYRQLNPSWQGFYPAMDYDAQNTAYSVYASSSHVLVSKSADGLAWSRPVQAGTYKLPPAGGEYGWPVLKGSNFRALNIPLMAVDRSDGPYAGSVYVVWFDHQGGDGEIRVAYSRDQGATFVEAPRPMDDDPTQAHDQFYPAISVDARGVVDVTWWDRRDDPERHLFHVYHTYSKDGGRTWAPNLRVTEVASDEQYSRHQNGMIFLGDYRDQDASALGAHLVWVDTRHGKADVFTAIVQR